MKIHHLLNGVSIAVTNEERNFIQNHGTSISISSLSEHDTWTAQNLVRKGVYKLTNDNNTIVLNRGYESNKSII